MGDWDDSDAREPMPIPRLFNAVDGLRFYAGRGKLEESYVLQGGCYMRGNGAITVWTARGECECKLTVNIETTRFVLNVPEFFVKNEERGLVHERLLDGGAYVVECVECRAFFEQLYCDRTIERDALDSVDRLKGREL